MITLAVVACLTASVRYQPAAAQAANGRIAFTNGNLIHTINPDGSGDVQLTPSGVGFVDNYPAWSPDGTKIAFGRTTLTVSSQIYVMNADGSNPTLLTNSAGNQQPSWSPDGTRIAFVSAREQHQANHNHCFRRTSVGLATTRFRTDADTYAHAVTHTHTVTDAFVYHFGIRHRRKWPGTRWCDDGDAKRRQRIGDHFYGPER